MWVLPVPRVADRDDVLAPLDILERASSSTSVLLSDGNAMKSKLSRLLTVGNFAALIRRSTIRRSRSISSSLGQPQQITRMVDALGGALAGHLVVLAQERRQLQRLQVMGQQDLRGVAHAAISAQQAPCTSAPRSSRRSPCGR